MAHRSHPFKTEVAAQTPRMSERSLRDAASADAGGRSLMNLVRSNALKIGGVLYVVAVFQYFIFELVAETLYPDYSVRNNYISDLGATCIAPPSITNCVVYQPSATIFNTTVFVLGFMLLAGTFFVYVDTRNKAFAVTALVADLAILLTGVLPENTGLIHALIGLFLFSFLGISLILAWQLVKNGSPMKYLVAASGILTLWFDLLGDQSATVGVGGDERLIVLCALLGIIALGGYLTGQASPVPTANGRAPGQGT